MKLRAKRGKWNGGLPPYGRRVEDGQLVIVPEEAAIDAAVQRAFLEVMHLLRPPSALVRPDIAARVLRGWRRRPSAA